MDSSRTVLSTVFVWAITLFVPGVVWSLLAAGLYQLIRDSIPGNVPKDANAGAQIGRLIWRMM
jgi:hypothetical protein